MQGISVPVFCFQSGVAVCYLKFLRNDYSNICKYKFKLIIYGTTLYFCEMILIKNLIYFINFNICLPRGKASRSVLSDAYLCEEAWNKRLQNPAIKNIKMDQYFMETDKKFGTKQLVSGVDLDRFANGVREESQLDELEHLLYKFRRTKRAIEIMDSTTYAVIHIFLKFKQYEPLLRILNDRENYGIFPDFYSYNLLMSTFLKEAMYREAANISVLMMFQEDFANKLSCLLGLYSCQMFLDNCSFDLLNKEEEVIKEEDDEEETLVRVPFIRNPWFDDHFEITNPKHLIGKTLYLIGREIKNPLGYSYQLVGLALYEKWDKATNLFNSFVSSENTFLLNDVEKKVKPLLEAIPEDNKNKMKYLDDFNKCFQEMETKEKILECNFSTTLEEALKDVPELEKYDIESQLNMFIDWENQRKSALEIQMKELDRQRRLKAIEDKKEYLYWKEKLLFFFENEEKNLEELEEVKKLVESLKEKGSVQSTYMPPEMTKIVPKRKTKYQRLALVKSL